MHAYMKRTLVQSILAAALGATFASAEIFTFPRHGTQLEPAKTVNATWRADILDRLLNANAAIPGNTTTAGAGSGSATSTLSASSSAVFSSSASTGSLFKRQDAANSGNFQSSGGSSATAVTSSTNTSSPPSTILDTSSTVTTSAASTTSADTTASPTGTPTTGGANATTPRCVSGMPTNMSDEDGIIQLCSTLELVAGESPKGTPLFLTTNFDVSAGWLEVRVPYVTPGDGYRLRMTIADGSGEDAFLSAPFSILPLQ
ncbi:hypothetical protein C8Q78DRAFT_1076995 [Trametes maxima]|nr:hypothetical protein C8Q78DRAFT_1076995 [Trametes maxima]